MASYKIVKYCNLCKVRFIINKGEVVKNYCDDCQKKIFDNKSEDD